MSLQFHGLLPLWLGLSLAIGMSLLSFRYYRRETRPLSNRLRWLLPTLRASALLLTVLLLAGPVPWFPVHLRASCTCLMLMMCASPGLMRWLLDGPHWWGGLQL